MATCAEELEMERERSYALARYAQHLQARIDALMLEYCPDEMTPKQIAEWERHRRPVSDEEQRAIEAALSVPNRD